MNGNEWISERKETVQNKVKLYRRAQNVIGEAIYSHKPLIEATVPSAAMHTVTFLRWRIEVQKVPLGSLEYWK